MKVEVGRLNEEIYFHNIVLTFLARCFEKHVSPGAVLSRPPHSVTVKVALAVMAGPPWCWGVAGPHARTERGKSIQVLLEVGLD